MTELDQDLVPAILELVNELGKDAVATVRTSQPYDRATSSVTVTTVDYPVKILPPSRYKREYVDGEMVRATDFKTMVAASGLPFTPEPNVKISFNNKQFTVISVGPIYTGEEIGAWRMQLRA